MTYGPYLYLAQEEKNGVNVCVCRERVNNKYMG